MNRQIVQPPLQRPGIMLGFDLVRLCLRFRALDLVRLPAFAGSTWRGALGQAVRRIVCVCPGTPCHTCILRPTCWYARLYETAIDSRCTLLQGYTDAPHPFVPEPWPLGGDLMPGAELSLDLVLIGRAQESVPALIQAAQRLAAFGLGRGRGRLELVQWGLEEMTAGTEPGPCNPPASPSHIRMILETPLRLRVDNRILDPESLEFRPLFTTLLRRISLLACCHGNGSLALDFKGLADAAGAVPITQRQIEWFRWARYSSRQGRHVSMDGLVGSLELDLSRTPDVWPSLWAGQWLHVGKGASMGMGRYRLHASTDDGRGVPQSVSCQT